MHQLPRSLGTEEGTSSQSAAENRQDKTQFERERERVINRRVSTLVLSKIPT